tara:strand:- start:249 stop:776 length:528 start_codon:yes stop_codon:yes gene_type:complete
MKKENLTEKNIYVDTLPNLSKVNNLELGKRLQEEYDNFIISPSNTYEDVDIPFLKEVKWISDYIEHKFLCYYGEDIYLTDHYINIQKPNHMSFKRNNIKLNDLRNSADYTALYVIDGSGNLYLEYDDNVKKQQTFVNYIKEKSIAMFNSDIQYFIDRNKTNYNRIILTFLYKKNK